ncbi:ribosome-associated translation inhibitor RaiA [Sandaracinobacter sp. RS1-74]|uniref:ribosome hibernation-promoting factor, HPF/YfiA family n=1 Tax=Sandaracinobacteroides sayramensis TaxID=2913411 RepID=UPI001EDAAA52|nr:ribosome-associated translation inhibitor RaiA [Sandaracinobacteroides sayramensis]MCG2841879.1 ribosome-associated translation inhibitor RaiA [Sandaracinobacteroides sayramensis]
MDIRVAGHQVETGQAFRVHVNDRLRAIADTYFKRAIGATVTLGPGPYDSFQCDIVMHVMQGLVLKGSNRAAVAQVAFDGAADKIEKQLRRYMRRLKDKSGSISLAELPLADLPDNAEYRIFEAAAEQEEAPDAPLTIAETRVDIPESSVSDAVMMLDLRNTTALLFKNSRTGSLNMVYRREDGNIGWVEPRA